MWLTLPSDTVSSKRVSQSFALAYLDRRRHFVQLLPKRQNVHLFHICAEIVRRFYSHLPTVTLRIINQYPGQNLVDSGVVRQLLRGQIRRHRSVIALPHLTSQILQQQLPRNQAALRPQQNQSPPKCAHPPRFAQNP